MKKLLLILCCTLSAAVYAETECELKYKQPSDVATCYEKESFSKVQKAYLRLNELSKQQLSYNKNVLQELSKSQKSWLGYRDSYCDTYINYHGEINNHANCIIELNNKRAEQLQKDIDSF